MLVALVLLHNAGHILGAPIFQEAKYPEFYIGISSGGLARLNIAICQQSTTNQAQPTIDDL